LKRVQQELVLLRKYATEAGTEPTYLWLPPFPAACYDKIQGSLGTGRTAAAALPPGTPLHECVSVSPAPTPPPGGRGR
jgi:hypothetical protein